MPDPILEEAAGWDPELWSSLIVCDRCGVAVADTYQAQHALFHTDLRSGISPAVLVGPGDGQADPATTIPVNFAVLFSEPVSGLVAADVDTTDSTAPGTLAAVVTGEGRTYNVAVSGMTGSGFVEVNLPAGAADSYGAIPSLASTTFGPNANRVQYNAP